VLLVTVAASLTGCGPGGVVLGHDWQGAELLALAKVNGQRVVIGIDPSGLRSENLIVIASKTQDDPVLGARITHAAGGPWLVTVPARQAPNLLYRVDAAQEALVGVGTIEAGRGVLPVGPRVVTVAAGSRAVGLLDASSGRVTRTWPSPVAAAYAAGSAAPDTLCVAHSGASGVRVAAVALATGRVSSTITLAARSVTAFGCRHGRPLLVSSAVPPAGSPSTGSASTGSASATSAELRRGPSTGVDELVVRGAVATAVATSDDSIFVALSNNARSEVLELDGRTGERVRQTAVDGLPVVRGLYRTAKGLVALGDERAAVIGATGSAYAFKLPGTLIAAPDVASD
jgi:hypothetical protein